MIRLIIASKWQVRKLNTLCKRFGYFRRVILFYCESESMGSWLFLNNVIVFGACLCTGSVRLLLIAIVISALYT